MSHPIEQKIAKLRSRLLRLVAVYGLSWTVAAVIGAVMVLGMADYVFRFQDRGLRVICSLLALGALGWACYRLLFLPLRVRLRDVELAVKLQRWFPKLEDRLVSSVEFLGQSQDDPTAGSAALRRAVIAETTAETERLDFSNVLDVRRPMRAAMVTAGICLVAAIFVVLDPLSSRIAVARLANPFGSAAWPRKNHLQLVNRVERIARGQAFEVEMIDAEGARLPTDACIHYRFTNPDGSAAAETRPMRLVGSRLVGRREGVARPFSYRITGGDDHTMSWIAVEVLEPPAIRSLSIRLIPPAYTGWPRQTAKKTIRALVGTRMEFAATVTKPLASATLCLEGNRRIPGRIGNDGLRFAAPGPKQPELLLDRSGSYWFELTDREGLSGASDDRWEIRAVRDAPPSVTIERPTGNLFVTPRAVVPLRVSAEDDLAIHRVALVFHRTTADTGEADEPQHSAEVLPLFTGPKKVERRQAAALASGAEQGDRRVTERRWELAPLELTPGTQLTFHATADDYRPQIATSGPRRLIVVTPGELLDRIAGRQEFILAEIARVLKCSEAAAPRSNRSKSGLPRRDASNNSTSTTCKRPS